jgi:threonine dehydrogenase-like Zn-dependent dehydrogenase
MRTKAVRIYGVNDLRLEEFDLPEMQDDEILARVVSDSICMSTHKLAMQGNAHKRVKGRYDLAKNPTITGHEFCGVIEKVGKKWQDKFRQGDKFIMQTALNVPDANGMPTLWAPGYSYQYVGGDATYIIIPNEVMEMDCLIDYNAAAYYMGSLSEPISCIIGAFHAQYHTKAGSYTHEMGLKQGGSLALLASVGPMGLGAIDYAVHGPRKPALVVVTDIAEDRLARAEELLSAEDAAKNGVKLVYVNTSKYGTDNAAVVKALRALNNGNLFDDVFCFAPVKPVVEMADMLLGRDGCLNFFAGPTNTAFSANLNFYNVHYEGHHLCGTSGGNTDDMKEAVDLFGKNQLNPSVLITHVGGLNEVANTTINLDKIPGGKKLIYTHKNLPLVAIADFAKKGAEGGALGAFYTDLAGICKRRLGLWSGEAEAYLLKNAPEIQELP